MPKNTKVVTRVSKECNSRHDFDVKTYLLLSQSTEATAKHSHTSFQLVIEVEILFSIHQMVQ